MLLKKRAFIIPSLLILIVSFASVGFGKITGEGTPEARALELKNLLDSIEGLAKEPPRVFKTKEGYLRFVMAPPSTNFVVGPDKRGTPQQAVGAFLKKWQNLFVNESPAVEFDVIRVKTSNSRSYVSYQQKFAGLVVFGAEVTVQVNASGGIVAVLSDIMRDTHALDQGEVLHFDLLCRWRNCDMLFTC
jgi:hypothetical protein